MASFTRKRSTLPEAADSGTTYTAPSCSSTYGYDRCEPVVSMVRERFSTLSRLGRTREMSPIPCAYWYFS